MNRIHFQKFVQYMVNVYGQLRAHAKSKNVVDALLNDASKAVSEFCQSEFHPNLPDQKQLESMTDPLYFSNIYDTEQMNLCLFGFRSINNEIPLHNHPDMYGFIKVIRGSVAIKSYSWLGAEDEAKFLSKNRLTIAPDSRLARFDGIGTSSSDGECLFLTPEERNVHSLQSLEAGTAFVDVFLPSYGERNCSYYVECEKIVDYDNRARICSLSEIPCPASYLTMSIPYQYLDQKFFEQF